MTTSYPIIANCNFESRNDVRGRAIHDSRIAVEHGLTDDEQLVSALDALEETLEECAESGYAHDVEECREAEREVARNWKRVEPAVDAERSRRQMSW